MHVLKKILFPFSWEKYDFLENKRWHRLFSVFFFLIMWLFLIFSFMYIYPTIEDISYHLKQIGNLEKQ